MLRNGTQYRNGLKDDRNVFINGDRVKDVTTHPAFSGIVDSTASLYDMSSSNSAKTAFCAPETGDLVSKVWMMPKTREELTDRREVYHMWAEPTLGLLGRCPAHVPAYISAFNAARDIFIDGHRDYVDNVDRNYRYLRDNDLYVTYTIVHPQMDRSKPAHQQKDKHWAVGVYKETDAGIIIRGSNMLGTGSAVADYIFVSVINPLPEGDEDYAISVLVPVNAPGLRLICRRGYAEGQPSSFDYPLSTRFDESDAFVVFDDVFVPWEQVLVYRNRRICRAQFYETPGQVWANTFAQVRSLTKLQFILGLAQRITRLQGTDKIPQVMEHLGVAASQVAIVESMLLASEYHSVTDKWGNALPQRRFLYAMMGIHPEVYNRVIQLVKEVTGAGFLQVPSSIDDLHHPVIRADLDKYLAAPNASADEKIKLMKLAWDMIGSEFAGRHQHYEMFYGGAPFVTRMLSHMNYDYSHAEDMVERFMSQYDTSNTTRAA